MSNPFGAAPANDSALTLPRGEVLGRYQSYLDAQKVVDYLADNDFPVANVSIIGNDLKSVERVTAKLSYPKVALAGAAQGAMFGVFVGLLLSLFTPTGGIAQILSSVGLGMAIWMIVGVVSYSFRKGKRDFASSSQVMAGYYDVVVAFEHAAAARQMASGLPMSRVEAQQAAPNWGGQSPSAPQGPAAAETPASPRGGADGAEQPRRSGFNDLPDGRPQFGIRVDPETASPEPGRESADGPAARAAGTDASAAQDSAVGPAGNTDEPGDTSVEPTRDNTSRPADQRKPGEGTGA